MTVPGTAGHGMAKADFDLELGDVGMGMPVIRSWQALKRLPVGAILHVSSSHP